MISSVYFDDQVVVDGGKDLGGGQRAQLREFSFHRRDGWSIRESLPGVFSLHCEGMPEPVTVGGYGYSYVTEPTPDVTMMPEGARVLSDGSVIVPYGEQPTGKRRKR